MGKKQIDIFNIDIYRHIVNLYNTYISQLEKYLSINSHMVGYYDNDEINYIVDIYSKMIEDLTNSQVFKMFMPNKANEEIKNTFIIIKNLKKTKKYQRILDKLKYIQKIINIEELI